MRAVTLASIALLTASCATPQHHRWTFSAPFEAGLHEEADISGVRFMSEAPVDANWTIYWAGTMLKPEADGSDAGTGNDFSGELYEAALGLRRYFFQGAMIRPFLFGEGAMGNEPFDTLDNFGFVWSVMVGAGLRVDLNRDWSVEGSWGLRHTYADVDTGAFPGLDAEDALNGGIAWIGIGYEF